MKQLFKLNIRNIVLLAGLVVVLLIAGCLTLDSVDVPTSGVANQVSTFTIHCSIKSYGDADTKLVIGVLVPKSWKTSSNTTLTYSSPKGDGSLSPVPSGTTEAASGNDWATALQNKYGIGENLLAEMEWVAFQSDKSYTIVNGDNFAFDVTVNIKLGSDNMMVKLGFFSGTIQNGIQNGINGEPYYGYYSQSGST